MAHPSFFEGWVFTRHINSHTYDVISRNDSGIETILWLGRPALYQFELLSEAGVAHPSFFEGWVLTRHINSHTYDVISRNDSGIETILWLGRPALYQFQLLSEAGVAHPSFFEGWVFTRHINSHTYGVISRNDSGIETILWLGRPALYQFQLLSEAGVAWYSVSPGTLSQHLGTSATTIPICRRRIRNHARTLSYSDQRAAIGRSFHRGASAQAAVRPDGPWEIAPSTARTEIILRNQRGAGSTHLAAAILRLQRLDGTQADRKAALHASQSGQARISSRTGAVALEQLPILFIWRTRDRSRQ